MSTTTSPIGSMDKEAVGRAIGRIPSGVHVLSLERNGKPDGLLSSWISQASFDPPMLSVAIKKERAFLSNLFDGAKFAVNILSKNNMDIYKNFAKPYQSELNRFAGLNVGMDEQGSPVLSDSVAYLSCVVKERLEAGDHLLLLSEIIGGKLLKADQEPMTHLRKNGFQY